MQTRRTFLYLASAALGMPAMANEAPSVNERHEREVVEFKPEALEDSIHVRLNALIARLSEDGGGTVRMVAGLYPTSAQIRLIDNVRLIGFTLPGEAPQTIIRLNQGAPSMAGNTGIIRAKRDDVPVPQRTVHGVSVEDLIIDGNRDGQRQDVSDDDKKYGIYAEAHDMVMRNVTTRYCMGYGFDPHGTIENRPSVRLLIEDCHSHNNQKDGFTLDFQLGLIIRRCRSEDNDRSGFNFTTSTRDTLMEQCIARRNGANGIVVQNDTGHLMLEKNELTDNTLNGIYLRDARVCRVTENHVYNNGRAGIRVRGGADIHINYNIVKENLADGETAQGEIHLDSWRGRGVERARISNNLIRAIRNSAVIEAEGASGTVIRDNIIQPPNASIRVSSEDAVVIGNSLK